MSINVQGLSQRKRKTFQFQLDLRKDTELALESAAKKLKSARRYKLAITSGIELFAADLDGNIERLADMIDRLFPRAVRWLVENHLSDEVRSLRAEVERLNAGRDMVNLPVLPQVKTATNTPEKVERQKQDKATLQAKANAMLDSMGDLFL